MTLPINPGVIIPIITGLWGRNRQGPSTGALKRLAVPIARAREREGGATGPTNPRGPARGPGAPPRGQGIDSAQPYTPPSARGPSPADIPLPGGARYVPPPWSADRYDWFEPTDANLEDLYRGLDLEDPNARDYNREELERRLELERAELELLGVLGTQATARELKERIKDLKRDIERARRAEVLKRDIEKIGKAREVMRDARARALPQVGRVLTGPVGAFILGVLWPQEMGPEKPIRRTRTRKRSGPAPEFTPPGQIGPPRRGGARRPQGAQAPAAPRPGPTALPGGARPAPRPRVAPGPRTTQAPRPVATASAPAPAPSRPVATLPRPAPSPRVTTRPTLPWWVSPLASIVLSGPSPGRPPRSAELGVGSTRVGGDRFRDPLTLTPLEDRAVPSGQPQPLPSPSGNCPPCDSKKRKRKKSQPRTECYSGTYTERARGLTKRKRRRVPCK